MNEQTQAASSPATDVFEGRANIGVQEYIDSRNAAAQAGPAPVDSPEETVQSEGSPESAGETETPKSEQEQPAKKHLTAQQRIAQIESTIEKLWQQDEPDVVKIGQLNATIEKINTGLKRKTEPAPVSQPNPQAQPAPAPRQTRPKPTPEATKPDGTPLYEKYEDYVEELADWKAEQRMAQYQQQQAQQEGMKATRAMLEDVRTRHEDADQVVFPAAQTIYEAQIPLAVKQVFADSDVFVDLCYKVGSDPDELKKFVQLAQGNPRAALAKVFEYETAIRAELGTSGKVSDSVKAPEQKKTQAPKPPSPVGGASSRSFDVSDESLSPEEWMRKRNAQLSRR